MQKNSPKIVSKIPNKEHTLTKVKYNWVNCSGKQLAKDYTDLTSFKPHVILSNLHRWQCNFINNTKYIAYWIQV